MNLKKKLKKENKKIRNNILENDGCLYEDLASKYCDKESARPVRVAARIKWWAFAATCLVLACVITFTCVCTTDWEDKKYYGTGWTDWSVMMSKEEVFEDMGQELPFGDRYMIDPTWTKFQSIWCNMPIYTGQVWVVEEGLTIGCLYIMDRTAYCQFIDTEMTASEFHGYPVAYLHTYWDGKTRDKYECVVYLENWKIFITFDCPYSEEAMSPYALLEGLFEF